MGHEHDQQYLPLLQEEPKRKAGGNSGNEFNR
jgi:hypothetical protein